MGQSQMVAKDPSISTRTQVRVLVHWTRKTSIVLVYHLLRFLARFGRRDQLFKCQSLATVGEAPALLHFFGPVPPLQLPIYILDDLGLLPCRFLVPKIACTIRAILALRNLLTLQRYTLAFNSDLCEHDVSLRLFRYGMFSYLFSSPIMCFHIGCQPWSLHSLYLNFYHQNACISTLTCWICLRSSFHLTATKSGKVIQRKYPVCSG